MTKNSKLPYFIFVIGLFFCLISSSFLTEGMFMDGTYYSSLSHKIASDKCSFWHMSFSNSLHKEFNEHPPLAFQMQSWFLSAFGDNIYCDKIYSVLTFIIVGFLICLIWKKITGEFESSWIPLLFWTTIPLVTWGATNDMLENTMSIFITASVYICLLEKRPYLSSVVAGFFVYLAFMVKGPTALFPLVFPFIQYFFQRDKKLSHYILRTIINVASAVLFFGLMLLISDDSRVFFSNYYHNQIELSFNSKPTVNYRIYIVWRWFCEMLIGISIIAVAFIIKHKKQTFKQLSRLNITVLEDDELRRNLNEALKFSILGLCGVLPIMVSMKQRGFYIIPTLPFFAISMALVFKSLYNGERIKKIVKYAISCTVLLIAITLNVINFGKVSRDKEMLHDIHVFENTIPREEIILIPNSLSTEYSLHGYFSRYFDATLSTKDYNNKYMIFPKDENPNDYEWFSKYEKVDINTEKYNLYTNKQITLQ